jgi:hypothetical protein
MTEIKGKYIFPSKRSMKKTRDLLEAGEIEDVQLQTASGSVLANLSLHSDPGEMIPRVFRLPAQAAGVGISTVAKILGLKIVFNAKLDEEKDGNDK